MTFRKQGIRLAYFNTKSSKPSLFASVNNTIFSSENGLSPICRHAIMWTNAGVLWIWILKKSLIQENTVKSVYETAAILSFTQWLKSIFKKQMCFCQLNTSLKNWFVERIANDDQ